MWRNMNNYYLYFFCETLPFAAFYRERRLCGWQADNSEFKVIAQPRTSNLSLTKCGPGNGVLDFIAHRFPTVCISAQIKIINLALQI